MNKRMKTLNNNQNFINKNLCKFLKILLINYNLIKIILKIEKIRNQNLKIRFKMKKNNNCKIVKSINKLRLMIKLFLKLIC